MKKLLIGTIACMSLSACAGELHTKSLGNNTHELRFDKNYVISSRAAVENNMWQAANDACPGGYEVVKMWVTKVDKVESHHRIIRCN